MDWEQFYSQAAWAALREEALRRDGDRCQVARLLGGHCSTSLHVHHLTRNPELALDIDNVATVCSRHHPMWDAVRRAILARRPERGPCRHRHRYDHARRACRERRMAA